MRATVLDFGRRWAARFVAVQGIDRGMALAAQAFSALIPLLIVYAAVVPRPSGRDFAGSVVHRFGLHGAAAQSMRDAFSSSDAVQDSISLIGLVLVVVSALAFTRGLQRLYEGAYELPALGLRGTRAGLTWLVLIVLYLTIRPPLASLLDGSLAHTVISLALAGVMWTLTPWLLLDRRLHWKALLPGAVLASVGMTTLATTTVIWLPHTVASSADEFGVIGVAFALLSWLVAASVVLVVTATGGAAGLDWIRERHA